MDLKSYKAVVFDLFHTLTSVESTRAPGRGTSEILGVLREDWNEQLLFHSEDRLRGRVKDSFEIVRKMAHAIDAQIPDEVIREAARTRAMRFRHALKYIEPGTVYVLKKLKDMGKLIGLISNGDVNEISGWDDSPLKRYFDSVVFSCFAGYIKPERKAYEMCFSKLQVLPEESLYIGDGNCDELKGAREIGMTTVLTIRVIKKIWPERIDERRKYADYEIDELKELFK